MSAVCRVLALVLLLSGGPAPAALFDRQVQDLAVFRQQVSRHSLRLVVVFELRDCPQCRYLHDQVFGQPAVEAAWQPYYRSVRVLLDDPRLLRTPDGQQCSALHWARSLGISGAPAFVFFDVQGRLETRYQGVLAADDLIRLGQYVQQGRYEDQPFRPEKRHLH